MPNKKDKTFIDLESIEGKLKRVNSSICDLQCKIGNDKDRLEELKRKKDEILSQISNKEIGRVYENKWFISYQNDSSQSYGYIYIYHVKSEGELKITEWGSFYRECELYQQISMVKDKAFNTETNSHRTISVEKDIKRVIYPRYINEISEDEVRQIIKKVIESIANDVSETLTNKILCNITDTN